MRKRGGFSLVELLLVVLVVGLLVGVLLPNFTGVKKRAAKAKIEACAQAIFQALEDYHSAYQRYPADLSLVNHNYLRPCHGVLVEGVVIPDTRPIPYDLEQGIAVAYGGVSANLTWNGLEFP